jgi:hypothetical protein
VRILDGRAPAQTDIRLLQMPQAGPGNLPPIWPALLAGNQATEDQAGDDGAPDGWDGTIR